MNSHAATLSVLSTPVALCDRRALSEAWFSALHVHKEAQQSKPLSPAARAAGPVTGTIQRGGRDGARVQPVALLPQRTLRSGGAARVAETPPCAERRSSRSKLARQIVRTFSRPAPPNHASFSIGEHRGRVQILLRSDGPFVTLVALCAPAARASVARALADARYALAMRGILLGTDVRGFVRA